MKQAVAALLLIVVGAAFAPVAFAYTSPGNPTGLVNDFAQVLSAQTKQMLENELADFERTTSNQIAVAIVPTMGGDYIENYAVKLFEDWKIGQKDKNNGVLLILSIAERKMRIEVGYGLEGALPDSVAQSILNNEMTPRLKVGDYDGAVTAGVQAIEAATKGEYTARPTTSSGQNYGQIIEYSFIFIIFVLQFLGAILARSRSWWAGGVIGFFASLGIWGYFGLGLIGAVFTIIGFTAFGLVFDYIVSMGYANAKARGMPLPWWVGGSFGGRAGGGGFGGGGSGGGGASGSW